MTTLERSETVVAVRRRRSRRPSGWHLALIPLAAIMATPFVLMLLTSLSTLEEPKHFPPQHP